MDIYGEESQLWPIYEAYCQQVESIKEKLKNNISEGKRGKLLFRLKDLQERLIPKLVKKMQEEI
jgi:hypothetical protein